MTLDYLECRDLGHAWKRRSTRWDGSARQFRSTAQCTRCATERVRVMDSTGDRVSTHYSYPDGYAIEGMGNLDRTERSLMRLTLLEQYCKDD